MPTFPLNEEIQDAVALGAHSKLYRCPAASIGITNAAALAAALVECGNTEAHEMMPGSVDVAINRSLVSGRTEYIDGIPEPKISFKLIELRRTADEAAEVDEILTVALTGGSMWLLTTSREKSAPGTIGLMGLFKLKATRKPDAKGVVSWDIEGVQAAVAYAAHLIEWYQTPA